MREKKYTIPIKPLPWKRAGISGRRFYDQQINEKIAYGLYLIREHGNDPIFDKALQLDIIFFMPTAQKQKIKEHYHKFTPDLSNLIKLLEDAMVDAKILTDDRLISIINAKKVYDPNPRTEFTVKELE